MKRPFRTLFVLFAPITLPVYLLWLALMTFVSGSYYITVELTLQPILGRPIALRKPAFWLLSPVFIALMPLAVAGQSLLWLVRQLGAMLALIGEWQSAVKARAIAIPFGAIWLIAAVWTAVSCVDPQAGFWMTGRRVPGAVEFEQAVRGRWTLARLSPESQVRRRELIESFTTGVNRELSGADFHREDLQRDATPFGQLRPALQRKLVNMPWHFQPYLLTYDGVDHSEFLAGCLLLGVMLLVRWPGMHRPRFPAPLTATLFLARTLAVVWAVHHVLTWSTIDFGHVRLDSPTRGFHLLSPAAWFFPLPTYYSPDWPALNVGLWLLLAGVAVLLWTIARAIGPILGAPGHYSAFLAVRLLQRKRIAFFSIGAVTLCVAMELIVISVMDGFLDTIRARSHTLLGDLIMDGGQGGFPFYEEFIAQLKSQPDFAIATPVIRSYGVLTFTERKYAKAVEVRGIRLDEYRQVTGFGEPGVLFYDQYFPGTTVFAPASQPFWGLDAAGDSPLLPEPFESAWKRMLRSKKHAEQKELLARWGRFAGDAFAGPGVFAVSEDFKPAMKGKSLPGMIIGRDLIASRMPSGDYERYDYYPRGTLCQLSLLSVNRAGKPDNQPIAPFFRYVDDSRTGVFEIDNRTVYVDCSELQDKLSLSPQQRAEGDGLTPARCNSIHLKLTDPATYRQMKDVVRRLWDQFTRDHDAHADEYDRLAMRNVEVVTWEEMQADFISAIQKEKVLTVIMFGIISVVAVLLVLCIFYMIVVEKTRDIGILKSVGGSAQGVAAVFLTYGAAIGVVGAVLGSLIGANFVHHINDVQDWLARLNPEWRVWSPQTYSFDKIPDVVKTTHMVWIGGFAILAAIIGAAGPAIRAARTWPVEALRYE